MLKALRIVNETASALGQVDLWIEGVPAFVRPKVWRVESVAEGVTRSLPDLDVDLDGPFLTRLTEAEQSTVSFTLRPRGDDTTALATLQCPVELLPRNQWGGLSHMPDLVAAFVQPNDPAVDRLLKKAADILRKNGKSPALDGYRAATSAPGNWFQQSGAPSPRLGLDYALPPASFEHTGQKVRGTGQVDGGRPGDLPGSRAVVLCRARAGRSEPDPGVHQGTCVRRRLAQG